MFPFNVHLKKEFTGHLIVTMFTHELFLMNIFKIGNIYFCLLIFYVSQHFDGRFIRLIAFLIFKCTSIPK